MTNPTLGAPPAPHLIKFTDDCFEIVGTVEEYEIGLSAPNYPEKFFTNREEAEKRAKVLGRPVTAYTRTIRRRVKWF